MNDDLLDDGLKAVMGPGRCGDYVPREKKIPDAKWEPVPAKKPPLVSCVKSIAPIAVTSSVVFWWMQAEYLAETTGFYALIVLALLGGVQIGKYVML